MPSQLTITFPTVASRIGTTFQFTLSTFGGNIIRVFRFKYLQNTGSSIRPKGWVYPVIGIGGTGDLNISDGTIAAILVASIMQSDYNGDNKVIISRVGNVITVDALDDDIFVDITEGLETIAETNVTTESALYFTDETISQDIGNSCGGFRLQLTLNRDYTKIIVNGSEQTVAATSTYDANLLRNIKYSIIFEAADGTRLRYPTSGGNLNVQDLSASNFEINEESSFTDNQARVTNNEPGILDIEYSIDDTNWQTSPLFTGLSIQAYTLYIRDSIGGNLLGCKVTLPFTITGGATTDKSPIISIPKVNSINFVRRQTIDNVNTFKNVTNSFSNEEKFGYLYCAETLFQNNDTSKIQLKSSYETVTATLREDDGTDSGISHPLTVNKRTDNINKFMSMDAIVQPYDNNFVLIYFNSGDIYDQGGSPIDQYTLDGNLPEFAIVGAKLEVGGYGTTKVEEIFYSDTLNKNCIVAPLDFTGPRPEEVIVKAIYDILSYDIYDFEIDWSTYGNGLYDIVLNFTDNDPTFPDEDYQTENIRIADEHPDTVAILYFNTNNRDIFYKYDIQHFIRVPVLNVDTLVQDEINSNVTDKSVRVVASSVTEGRSFLFEEMPRHLAIKTIIALSCEYVFIEGIGFAKFEPFELENIPNTNLSRVRANMLITDSNINNIDDYINDTAGEEIDFDVPFINVEDLVVIRTPNVFVGGTRSGDNGPRG